MKEIQIIEKIKKAVEDVAVIDGSEKQIAYAKSLQIRFIDNLDFYIDMSDDVDGDMETITWEVLHSTCESLEKAIIYATGKELSISTLIAHWEYLANH